MEAPQSRRGGGAFEETGKADFFFLFLLLLLLQLRLLCFIFFFRVVSCFDGVLTVCFDCFGWFLLYAGVGFKHEQK